MTCLVTFKRILLTKCKLNLRPSIEARHIILRYQTRLFIFMLGYYSSSELVMAIKTNTHGNFACFFLQIAHIMTTEKLELCAAIAQIISRESNLFIRSHVPENHFSTLVRAEATVEIYRVLRTPLFKFPREFSRVMSRNDSMDSPRSCSSGDQVGQRFWILASWILGNSQLSQINFVSNFFQEIVTE